MPRLTALVAPAQRMLSFAVAILLAVASTSCSVDQKSNFGTRIDARVTSNEDPDAAIEIPDAAPPAVDAKVCSNGRVIFLNFDGVTLTNAATTNAVQNQINWGPTRTIPAFNAGLGTRAQLIADITSLARANLSQFPVTVVTTRPATGPYIMVVFGGPRTTYLPDNTYPAVTGFNCADAVKSGVGWVADDVTAQQGANLVASIAGIAIGLTGVTENKPDACLCGWAGYNNCNPNQTAACTLSTAITRQQVCPGDPAQQNEVAAFDKAFCKPL